MSLGRGPPSSRPRCMGKPRCLWGFLLPTVTDTQCRRPWGSFCRLSQAGQEGVFCGWTERARAQALLGLLGVWSQGRESWGL